MSELDPLPFVKEVRIGHRLSTSLSRPPPSSSPPPWIWGKGEGKGEGKGAARGPPGKKWSWS